MVQEIPGRFAVRKHAPGSKPGKHGTFHEGSGKLTGHLRNAYAALRRCKTPRRMLSARADNHGTSVKADTELLVLGPFRRRWC